MLPAVQQEEGGASLALSGEWTLARIREVDAALSAARLPPAPVTLDGARLQTLVIDEGFSSQDTPRGRR